jgi:ferredoxin
VEARLFVDRSRCAGSGQCVLAEPGVFTRGGDGKVLLRPGPGADLDQARAAAARCPSGALSVAEYEVSEV